jgi:hypothetical protein
MFSPPVIVKKIKVFMPIYMEFVLVNSVIVKKANQKMQVLKIMVD